MSEAQDFNTRVKEFIDEQKFLSYDEAMLWVHLSTIISEQEKMIEKLRQEIGLLNNEVWAEGEL